MGTKLKRFSKSWMAKTIAFIIAISCFSIGLSTFVNYVMDDDTFKDFSIITEDNYYEGNSYIREVNTLLHNLERITQEYKSEEYIKGGNTVREEEVEREENELYSHFANNSKQYNPKLSYEENYKIFKEVYSEEIANINERVIERDLNGYNRFLKGLEEYEGMIYYVDSEEGILTNTSITSKDDFKSYPSYIVFDGSTIEVHPKEIENNRDYNWIEGTFRLNNDNDFLYLAFNDDFLNERITKWEEDKEEVTNMIYDLLGLILGLLISFIYLLFTIGRKSEDDKVYLNTIDRLYNDINVLFCLGLIFTWFAFVNTLHYSRFYQGTLPITMTIGALGLMLVLSLVKHIKNKTLIKHTLIFTIGYKVYKLIKEVYNSGSVGVKIVLIVIGYPALVAITFFMFPITIGLAVWIALKKVKEYISIKEGVEKVKNGNLSYKINVQSNGEFKKLAEDINSITEGLNKAVDNEVKSERLKTELISNVSHDIRTPLTSIITYVDLLKKEREPNKVEEYINILEKKSQKLKVLTDDLFEASKATSGNIPVNYDKIDILSLITQGLGELDDKIKMSNLEFKINNPKEKLYMNADGKLLWRAIENLMSNIFKYSLSGSRVYIDIMEVDENICLNIKNISAYELNISSDELMERFKRGDESRSSEGSGLGLSIAKSLIELQGGSFNIEIDGDLFKAKVIMPKHE